MVSWWKYKTSRTWISTLNCAANTFRAAHKSYYNESDSCEDCPSWQTSSAWSTSCSSSTSSTTSCANYSCYWSNHWWGGAWKCVWNSSYSSCPSWVSYSNLGGTSSTNFCSTVGEICCLDYTSGWLQYHTQARCTYNGS